MEVEEEIKKPKSGINKTAILVALILGLSVVGYGYLNISYKNKVFEAEQARKTREWLAEEAEKGKRERELKDCLWDADEAYSYRWSKECEAQGKLTDRCISLGEMTFDKYAEQNNIPPDKRLDAAEEFYKGQEDCYCRMPSANADSINETLEKRKEECFKKYPVE